MDNFGSRLKEERKRLGLNQAQLAELASTTNVSQSRYENGERSPDCDYLSRVAEAGVDVMYILSGRRDTSKLTPDEVDLVRRYREAHSAVRAAALAALASSATSPKVQQTFHEGVTIGQHIKGDMTVTAPFTMHVGAPVKKKGKQRTS